MRKLYQNSSLKEARIRTNAFDKLLGTHYLHLCIQASPPEYVKLPA